MSEILLQIDGKAVKADEGMTILQAAQSAGDLHTDTLSPREVGAVWRVPDLHGGSGSARQEELTWCPASIRWRKDLVVRTRSEKVDKVRRVILEELLAHAPNSPELVHLAQEYGADRDRFEKESSFCILCGLCVRYCAEIKQKNAVGFIERGARREIRFIPEIAAKECWSCQECFRALPDFSGAGRLLFDRSARVSRSSVRHPPHSA